MWGDASRVEQRNDGENDENLPGVSSFLKYEFRVSFISDFVTEKTQSGYRHGGIR